MAITGSLPTGLDIGEGQTLYFQQLPILVGERLLLVSFLGGADEITTGTTTLTVIDTASDLGTSILVQTTAGGGIRSGIEIPGQVATVIRLF